MYVSPSLRPLVALLIERLPGCAHPWGRALARVLRTRMVLAFPLPGRLAGFTNPLLPVILIDRRLALRLDDTSTTLDGDGRIIHPLGCNVGQLLLHEAAHQLWAVWPEWRRWIGLRHVYGPSVNAADAIAEGVCRELCLHTKYAGQDIAYRSPLRIFGQRYRR